MVKVEKYALNQGAPGKERIRMAVSKAHIKATNKWMAKAYDRVNLTLPKGQKEVVQAYAAARGESVNGFIGRAISETMERDGGGMASEIAQRAAETAQGARVVSLPSETVKAAQEAADATGECLPDFIRRAVETQTQRDKLSLRLGTNPATESKPQTDQE